MKVSSSALEDAFFMSAVFVICTHKMWGKLGMDDFFDGKKTEYQYKYVYLRSKQINKRFI